MAEGRPTIQIPRWIQLVGLPVLALLAWAFAGRLCHARFQRARNPHGLAVAVVYLVFAAGVTVGIVALGTVVVEQTRSAADRVDSYLTDEPGRSGDT